MEIKKENIGHLNELITIDIFPEDYQEKVDKSLKDFKRKANFPGFRKGMVPMGMVEKMYGKSVRYEEIVKLTNDKFYEYLKENKLNILFEPIARSDKSIGNFEKTDTFSFAFEIGLQPEIIVNYDEAKKVINYKITATNEEIDAEIMSLRKRLGKFSSSETVAAEDMLLVTVNPLNGGEEFTSSILLNYIKDKELGNFIGKKLHDEMEIDTTQVFKSDHERSTFLKVKLDALETAPTNIHIKIDAIHHIEPAEIDADFYEKIFPDGSITNEKKLRESIKKQIELRYVNDANTLYRHQIMDTLANNTSFALPDSFIKKYLVENREEYTTDNIEEKYNEIKKAIDYQLVEKQITKDCNIDVNKEELLFYMNDYVRKSYFGTTESLTEEQEERIKQLLEEMMKKEENVKNAYENIFFEKLIYALKEKLNPKVKELPFKDFVDELSGKTPPLTPPKAEKKSESKKTEEKKPDIEKVKTPAAKKTKTQTDEKATKTPTKKQKLS